VRIVNRLALIVMGIVLLLSAALVSAQATPMPQPAPTPEPQTLSLPFDATGLPIVPSLITEFVGWSRESIKNRIDAAKNNYDLHGWYDTPFLGVIGVQFYLIFLSNHLGAWLWFALNTIVLSFILGFVFGLIGIDMWLVSKLNYEWFAQLVSWFLRAVLAIAIVYTL